MMNRSRGDKDGKKKVKNGLGLSFIWRRNSLYCRDFSKLDILWCDDKPLYAHLSLWKYLQINECSFTISVTLKQGPEKYFAKSTSSDVCQWLTFLSKFIRGMMRPDLNNDDINVRNDDEKGFHLNIFEDHESNKTRMKTWTSVYKMVGRWEEIFYQKISKIIQN